MTRMKRICVFCGSSVGGNGLYRDAACDLGRQIVARGCTLVYGGGSVGLMGVIADSVLACGGEVIGVLPEMLATKELAHTGITDMQVVSSMHARKARMAELADGFVAMPGGYGTFEELFEVITWAQLGIHAKPVGVLNVAGYFDAFVRLIDQGIGEGFIKEKHRQLIVVHDRPEGLLDELARHKMPAVRRWVRPEQA